MSLKHLSLYVIAFTVYFFKCEKENTLIYNFYLKRIHIKDIIEFRKISFLDNLKLSCKITTINH